MAKKMTVYGLTLASSGYEEQNRCLVSDLAKPVNFDDYSLAFLEIGTSTPRLVDCFTIELLLRTRTERPPFPVLSRK